MKSTVNTTSTETTPSTTTMNATTTTTPSTPSSAPAQSVPAQVTAKVSTKHMVHLVKGILRTPVTTMAKPLARAVWKTLAGSPKWHVGGDALLVSSQGGFINYLTFTPLADGKVDVEMERDLNCDYDEAEATAHLDGAPQKDNKCFITVTSGISGHFAVLVGLMEDSDTEYEPYETGLGRYDSIDKAIVEARSWALSEELELIVPGRNLPTEPVKPQLTQEAWADECDRAKTGLTTEQLVRVAKKVMRKN